MLVSGNSGLAAHYHLLDQCVWWLRDGLVLNECCLIFLQGKIRRSSVQPQASRVCLGEESPLAPHLHQLLKRIPFSAVSHVPAHTAEL